MYLVIEAVSGCLHSFVSPTQSVSQCCFCHGLDKKKKKNWEYVTAQVIRVPESVMYVHLSVCTCKLPTIELHVANKNCRKASSLTIRYGYLTAGDLAVFCVQPPPYNIK